MPGAHQVWGKGDRELYVNQWEGAITRDNAQYRLIEKHGKECDLVH